MTDQEQVPEESVPRWRFNRISKKLKESTGQLAERDRTIKELEQKLKDKETEHGTALERARAEHAAKLEEATLEGLLEKPEWPVIRAGYDSLPKEGRKPLVEIVREARTDPTKAPRFLTPYLPSASDDKKKGKEKKEDRDKPKNRVPGPGPESGDGELSVEQVEKIVADPELFKKHKDEIRDLLRKTA